jgi:hypothetical protein
VPGVLGAAQALCEPGGRASSPYLRIPSLTHSVGASFHGVRRNRALMTSYHRFRTDYRGMLTTQDGSGRNRHWRLHSYVRLYGDAPNIAGSLRAEGRRRTDARLTGHYETHRWFDAKRPLRATSEIGFAYNDRERMDRSRDQELGEGGQRRCGPHRTSAGRHADEI